MNLFSLKICQFNLLTTLVLQTTITREKLNKSIYPESNRLTPTSFWWIGIESSHHSCLQENKPSKVFDVALKRSTQFGDGSDGNCVIRSVVERVNKNKKKKKKNSD
uniref:NifJ protein n=1 Tax=Fopius arisanus TaxID=64838 RepID=A0A0C9R7I3_9HYME